MSEAKRDHRSDIDGLRAFAIVPVVLYHVGLAGVPGGFVGVDVFFVISGFLITGLLLQEGARSGRIDLPAFYARRVRRLFPAAALVLLTAFVLGMAMLTPFGEQQQLAKSALAATAFVSNFFFWATSGGYFADPADLKPLLHTWSLSIEEQYYVIWPALFWGVVVLARKLGASLSTYTGVLLVAVIVFSLGLSWYWTPIKPDSAFFLLPSRAWELALGGLLAVCVPWLRTLPQRLGHVLGIAGLVLVCYAVAAFNERMAFPGLIAAIPAGGAALAIAGGTIAANGPAFRLLSLPPLRYIGFVSYSWYLWHWPLLSIARAQAMGERDLLRDSLIGAVSLLLAIATYRLLEKPILDRRPGPFGRTWTTLAAGIVISTFVAAGAVALGWSAKQAVRGQPIVAALDLAIAKAKLRDNCNEAPPFDGHLEPMDECSIGTHDRPVELLLWGDSHAEHYASLLDEFAKTRAVHVLQRTMSACPPGPGGAEPIGHVVSKGCAEFNAAVLDELRARRKDGLAGVVIGGRWPWYLSVPPITRVEQNEVFATERFGAADPQQSRARLETNLRAMLDELSAAGLRVLLVAPTPELRFQAPNCLSRHPPAFCATQRAEVEQYRHLVMEVFTRVTAGRDNVRVWDPAETLCDSNACVPMSGDLVLYRDDDHLSLNGARSLATAASPALAWVAGEAPTLQARATPHVGASTRR